MTALHRSFSVIAVFTSILPRPHCLVCAGVFLAVQILSAGEPANAPVPVVVSAEAIKVESFFGLGIQWDPYSYSPRSEAWQETCRRLDFARPAFFRVMTGGKSYCLGFEAGKPRYVWSQGESEIRRRLGDLLNILDYAQSNHIEVLLGEWSPPGRFGDTDVSRPDNVRWAQLAADFVQWLRDVRGYAVVRKFNLMNEPNGNWMWPPGQVDYAAWATGVRNLRRELDARGLETVSIVGPDNSGDWEWLDRASHDLPAAIGDWEMHWYATDTEVLDGKLRELLAAKRNVLFQNDVNVASKRMFLAESGLLDGKTNGDQQPRVKTFEYGVLMADYAAQVMQADWMGLCAWDMDDAMHTASGHPLVPGEKTLKMWGFWNTQGTAMGHPEDELARPWFYTWSLMSRFFPRDARLLKVTQPSIPQLRIVAARHPGDGHFALMVVNDNAGTRTVNLKIPAAGKRSMVEYHYFEQDRPVGPDGFPAPKATLTNADFTAGVEIRLRSRGVIFVETK